MVAPGPRQWQAGSLLLGGNAPGAPHCAISRRPILCYEGKAKQRNTAQPGASVRPPKYH